MPRKYVDREARFTLLAELLEADATREYIAWRLGVSMGRVQQLILSAQGRCLLCGSYELETKSYCKRHAERARNAQRKRLADPEYLRQHRDAQRARRLRKDPGAPLRRELRRQKKQERLELSIAEWNADRALLDERRTAEITALRLPRERHRGMRLAIAYGLQSGLSYNAIADSLGVSRERIRQIVALAVTGTVRSLKGLGYGYSMRKFPQ